MKHKIFIVIILTVVLGCNSKKPENLIEKEKFIQVLTDIHIADGVLAVKGYKVNTNTEQIESVYQDVLNKHNITQKDFSTSVNYYSEDIKKLEKMYQKVSENLAKKESQLQNKIKESREDEPDKKKRNKIGWL